MRHHIVLIARKCPYVRFHPGNYKERNAYILSDEICVLISLFYLLHTCLSVIMDWIDSRDMDNVKIPSSGASESFVEPGKMKVAYFSNEFPYDDTRDLFRRLYVHSKDKRYPTLARFISEATSVLRNEVAVLPTVLRELVPTFDTIFSLVDHTAVRQGRLGGAIDGVLLCALHIATLIG
jgi:Starter unit:ACP transacylase in aflatoxin biosynthesis